MHPTCRSLHTVSKTLSESGHSMPLGPKTAILKTPKSDAITLQLESVVPATCNNVAKRGDNNSETGKPQPGGGVMTKAVAVAMSSIGQRHDASCT